MARQLVIFGTEGTIFSRGTVPRVPATVAPSAPTSPLLVFEGVQKFRPGSGAPAIAWLDFAVPHGEFLTLLGPAGAGKTLALDLVAGFAQPDHGRVLLGGENLARLPPHRRGIGLVSAEPDLFPYMTVLANIAFPLEARGIARAEREERATRMLGHVGLPANLGDHPPDSLSPARQLRVALARALVFAPPLLLLDDPLRALEGEDRAALAADLRRLHGELRLTTLHATRDAPTALALSDRVAILDSGRIRQAGTPRVLYETPADPAIATLTGLCNRLPGTVVTIEDDTCHLRLDCGLDALGLPVAGMDGPPTPGARCTLVIRPEHIAVAALSAAEMGEDAVPARVVESAFCGEQVRLRLTIGDGGELIAHRPAGLPLPEPGGIASVAWNVGAARVYAG
jgi:ABC-type Fe3+/spermidine/putrescine transport system ATPase subunit